MDELVVVFAISPSKIQEENIFLEAQWLISKHDHLSSSRISVGISLWEMHILGPLSRPTNSETLELMPNNPFFEALQVVLTKLKYVVVVVVQCSFMSDSLRPYGPQHVRLPCPSPPPRACSNSCPSSRWYHPTVSVVIFSSCLQSFPATGSFLMRWFFASGGQSMGVSESVLPMNIQDWFPLGWASLICLQSKGLLRVFSNTTVQKHQFFGAQPPLCSNSHLHIWLLEKP